MATHEHLSKPDAKGAERAAQSGPKVARTQAQVALNLQRTAGNRSAARMLARFKPHPDPEHKEEVVPDSAWEGLMKFSPPKPK